MFFRLIGLAIVVPGAAMVLRAKALEDWVEVRRQRWWVYWYGDEFERGRCSRAYGIFVIAVSGLVIAGLGLTALIGGAEAFPE